MIIFLVIIKRDLEIITHIKQYSANMEKVSREFTETYVPKPNPDNIENAGDWVSELFKPTFACTVEDISTGKDEEFQIESKIKRVRVFDPAAIKEVYNKVRLMNIMDEEMQKAKLKQIPSSSVNFTETRDLQKSQSFSPASIPDDSEPKLDYSEEDLEQSGIWDTEELDVLRKVFKSAKTQISDLKVKLREYEARNKYLEGVVKKQEYEIEKSDIKLREAAKSNKRLTIHCENLQHQLDHSGAKLDTVTDMWKEIDKEKSKMMKEIQDVRVSHDKERLLRENLELKLEHAVQERHRAVDIAVENTKMKYEKQLFDLRRDQKELVKEFAKEKQLYGVTNKALNHLRQHFSSLPVENIVPPNAVTEDQVSNISFVS